MSANLSVFFCVLIDAQILYFTLYREKNKSWIHQSRSSQTQRISQSSIVACKKYGGVQSITFSPVKLGKRFLDCPRSRFIFFFCCGSEAWHIAASYFHIVNGRKQQCYLNQNNFINLCVRLLCSSSIIYKSICRNHTIVYLSFYLFLIIF